LSLEARIDCVANTVVRSVACALAAGNVMETDARSGTRFAVGGPLRDIIVGNQGGYVKLISSNIGVAAGVFSFDVRLQNLLAQPIGTTNGFSAAAAGSRVFFASGPTVTSGTGTIDFVNGAGFYYDGTGTFTASNQPYYQYTQLLNTGDTSAVKRWSLRFDPAVATFAFAVYVSTPVKFPDGYISGNPNVLTLSPAEASSPLGGTVRSAVGNPIGGTIQYVSQDPAVASVSAGGVVTAGPSRGITFITLSSGSLPIPNYLSTAINVCASTPTIVSGATVNGAIDANDCYSSFAGNLGRPEPNYRSDMYRVSLTAGQQIAISLTTDGTFTPYLTLVNPLGVIEQSVIGSGSTAVMPAGAAVQQTGIYTVEAGQSDEYATVSAVPGYTGGYSITTTVSP
jgi:hypothetical protein